MATVRAKFRVMRKSLVAGWQPSDSPTQVISLNPVTSGSTENEQFYKFTPGGNIELSVLNDEAGEKFILGKEYYVDFTLAN